MLFCDWCYQLPSWVCLARVPTFGACPGGGESWLIGLLTQLAEYSAFNRLVPGSSPGQPKIVSMFKKVRRIELTLKQNK